MRTKGGKPLPNATGSDHQRKRLSRPKELLINRPPPRKLSEQRRQISEASTTGRLRTAAKRQRTTRVGLSELPTLATQGGTSREIADSGVLYSATNTNARG
ncbi:alpha-hydroxy-acid oxidizing protein [Sesbania bispinosa]|nr:alpha-hydroxy-acid oxidizing protein [Sesbania bispinosa]